jgi:serine/threonine protein kinase
VTDSASNTAQLGKYQLVAEIARGGMGIVYLAHAGGVGGFNKLVVVKELKPELAHEESFREMFLDEARLTARLNHRNIVQTNEVGNADGRYFIAMDYLEGRALNRANKAFEKTKPIGLNTTLRIFAETLAGLHYAHELADFDGSSLGIVHRDVCPQNVFITFDGQVKILDFGVAKARNRLQETQAGTLKGRVAYMSPEQLGGTGVDRRADVFAVGAMLWEALAGKRMWGQAPELDILRALVERKIPPLPEDVKAPEELRAMVAKATDSDPTKRYATAHEFRQQIEQYLLRVPAEETLTDLGARMNDAFAEEREKLRKVVEGHVAKGSSRHIQLPRLDFKGVPAAQNSEPSISGVTPHPAIDSQPSQPSQPSSPGVSNSGVSQVSAVSNVTPSAGTAMGAEVPSLVLRQPKASKLPWVVGGIAALIAIGAVGYAMNTQKPPPVTNATPTPSATPFPTEIPASDLWQTKFTQVEAVDVAVVVAPPNATIFLDGAQLAGNPYSAKHKRGGKHKITATAPGFLPKTQDADFEGNVQITLSLEKAPPGTIMGPNGMLVPAPGLSSGVKPMPSAAPSASAGGTQPAHSASSGKPTDINPQGGTAPVHKIDPNNPYGQ